MAKSTKELKKLRTFTKTSLAGLLAPQKKREWYYDEECPGLVIIIYPSGKKGFYYYRRMNTGPKCYRGPQRILIGWYPQVSVERARKQARIYTGQVAEGRNPYAELMAEKRTVEEPAPVRKDTFGIAWDWYLEHHAKKRKRTWKADLDIYEKHLKPWANRSLSEILPADVEKLHTILSKKTPAGEGKGKARGGPYLANRVLALVSTIFNKATKANLFQGDNPCRWVEKFEEESRERFLQEDEIPRFFAALDKESDLSRDFFYLALFTGARRGNVQAMEWKEINFDSGTWHIPAKKAKAGKSISLPLVGPALEILERRRELAGVSPYVFPSHGKTGHIADPKSAWKRIIKRAGLEDVRIHDLRRSLGSWQSKLGASLQVIGASLGHGDLRSTTVYARLQLDSVRKSMDDASKAILGVRDARLIEHAKQETTNEAENAAPISDMEQIPQDAAHVD